MARAKGASKGQPAASTSEPVNEPSGKPMFMSVEAELVAAMTDAEVLALAPGDVEEIKAAQAMFAIPELDLGGPDVEPLVVRYRRAVAAAAVSVVKADQASESAQAETDEAKALREAAEAGATQQTSNEPVRTAVAPAGNAGYSFQPKPVASPEPPPPPASESRGSGYSFQK